MNDYVVYTMAMAKYLTKMGFIWNRVAVDKYDNTHVIFYFQYSPELVNAVEKYKEARKNGMYPG